MDLPRSDTMTVTGTVHFELAHSHFVVNYTAEVQNGKVVWVIDEKVVECGFDYMDMEGEYNEALMSAVERHAAGAV
jgi:hypothetical protein